jgi:chromosome partitioning protein
MQKALELVGMAEITQLAGVSRQTVSYWRSLPDFPKPLKELAMGPVFDLVDIQRWLAEHRIQGQDS